MAVSSHLGVMLAGATLLAACGDFGSARTVGPLYVNVILDMSNSTRVTGDAWSATVCADSACKTFSPASCAADTGTNCYMGVGMTITFQYPTLDDRPSKLSVRIVSDAGKLLYSDARSNDCRLVQNICTAKFLVP